MPLPAGKPLDPLPDKMVGSQGQILYPYGNPPDRESFRPSSIKDTRDLRDPEELGKSMRK